MKTVRIVLSCIGGLLVIAVILFVVLNLGMGEIRKLVISSVDLTRVADGVYNGKYHKGRWTYDVRVTVKGRKIVGIENTNRKMEMFKDLNAKAAAEIIRKQSPQIDIVSGATITTRAFEKAVENALDSAAKK
jgi:uncharacterized protein with FMN-binding domain